MGSRPDGTLQANARGAPVDVGIDQFQASAEKVRLGVRQFDGGGPTGLKKLASSSLILFSGDQAAAGSPRGDLRLSQRPLGGVDLGADRVADAGLLGAHCGLLGR